MKLNPDNKAVSVNRIEQTGVKSNVRFDIPEGGDLDVLIKDQVVHITITDVHGFVTEYGIFNAPVFLEFVK